MRIDVQSASCLLVLITVRLWQKNSTSDTAEEADEIKFDSLLDILTLSRDERNFLKQQIAVKKALVKAESLIAKEIHTDV